MKKTLLSLLSIVLVILFNTGCVTEVGVYDPSPAVVYVNPYPIVVYPRPYYYYRHQVIHPHSIYVSPPIRSGPHHR